MFLGSGEAGLSGERCSGHQPADSRHRRRRRRAARGERSYKRLHAREPDWTARALGSEWGAGRNGEGDQRDERQRGAMGALYTVPKSSRWTRRERDVAVAGGEKFEEA